MIRGLTQLRAMASQMKYQLVLTYMLISLIILSVSGILFFNFFSSRTIRENHDYMEQLSKQIALNLEKTVNDMEKATFLLNYENELGELTRVKSEYLPYSGADYSEYRSLDNYVFNLIYSVRELYGVYIYSLDGDNLFWRNRLLASPSNESVRDESWFRQALQNHGRMTLIGRHRNSYINDNTEVISVARAIVNYANNELLGVILIDLDLKQIERVIGDVQIGRQGAVIILDANNDMVYNNNAKLIEGWGQQLREVATQMDMSLTLTLGQGNDKLLLSGGRSDYLGWKVLIVSPYSEIVKETSVFARQIGFLFALCTLIAFVLAYVISGSMSKNIYLMKRFMEKVEGGVLDVRMPVKGRNEVAKLAEGFNAMLDKIKHLINVEWNEKWMRQQAELNLLNAQINPHFLYNTLGSIKGLAEDEGSRRTAQMIQHLALLFRYNVGKAGSVVTVGDEIEHIKNYLALQQHRFDDRLTVRLDIQEDARDEQIPVFTLQPVIENCFVHGFRNKLGELAVDITARYEGEHAVITVADNGDSPDTAKLEELNAGLAEKGSVAKYMVDSKIGIYNVNVRIKQLFGDSCGIKLGKNEHGGVTAEIRLPRQP